MLVSFISSEIRRDLFWSNVNLVLVLSLYFHTQSECRTEELPDINLSQVKEIYQTARRVTLNLMGNYWYVFYFNRLRKINGIFIYGKPQVSVLGIGSAHFNIYRLSDALTTKGWNLNALQFPSRYRCIFCNNVNSLQDTFFVLSCINLLMKTNTYSQHRLIWTENMRKCYSNYTIIRIFRCLNLRIYPFS